MKKLYIFVLISAAVFTNMLFSMEEDSATSVSAFKKFKAIVRRASFSSKDTPKQENLVTRTRSGSGSGFDLRRWRGMVIAIIKHDEKQTSFTSQELAEHKLKLKEYFIRGGIIKARSQDEWTESDTARLAQLGKLAPKEDTQKDIVLLEQSNGTVQAHAQNECTEMNTNHLTQLNKLMPKEDNKKVKVLEQPNSLVSTEQLSTWHQTVVDLTDAYIHSKYTNTAHNEKVGAFILQIIEIKKTTGNELPDLQRIFNLLCDYYLQHTENLKDKAIKETRSTIHSFTMSHNIKKSAKKEVTN